MDNKGLIHLYYGNGKGKTTAAIGLCIRASGCGKNVVFTQFLKNWNTGELAQLKLLPNITVLRGKMPGGTFVHEMTDEQRAQAKASHDEILKQALELQKNGRCDMLVLDECIDAYRLELLDHALFDDLLANKPPELELVLTGHNPDPRHIALADYVTEMVKHRHPYDAGVTARRGVEF